MQRFYEFSLIFEFDNVKPETILVDFLQKWKIKCMTASYQCVLRFFHSNSLSIVPATKKRDQVIRNAVAVMQNHLAKIEDLMLKNAIPRKKSMPGPPDI